MDKKIKFFLVFSIAIMILSMTFVPVSTSRLFDIDIADIENIEKEVSPKLSDIECNDNLVLLAFYNKHQEKIIELEQLILEYLETTDSFNNQYHQTYTFKQTLQQAFNEYNQVQPLNIHNGLGHINQNQQINIPQYQPTLEFPEIPPEIIILTEELEQAFIDEFDFDLKSNSLISEDKGVKELMSGGVTKHEWSFHLWLIFPGILYKLWFNHQDTNHLGGLWEISFIFVIFAMSTKIGGLPGSVVGLVINLVLAIIKYFGGVETNPFFSVDEGSGIFIQYWDSLVPLPGGWGLDLFRFEPQ